MSRINKDSYWGNNYYDDGKRGFYQDSTSNEEYFRRLEYERMCQQQREWDLERERKRKEEELLKHFTITDHILTGKQTPNGSTSFEIDLAKFKSIKLHGSIHEFLHSVKENKFFTKYQTGLQSVFEIKSGSPDVRKLVCVFELENKISNHKTFCGFFIKSLKMAETMFEVGFFDIVKYIQPTEDDQKYGFKIILKNSGIESVEDLVKNKFKQLEEIKKEENENMANGNNVSMLESTMVNAKTAIADGMQLAVSNQASEVILGLVSDILGVDHPVLRTDEGRALAKIVGALLAETLATSLLDVNTAKQVNGICQSAATFNVAALLNGKLDVIRPRLLQLVNVASLPASK